MESFLLCLLAYYLDGEDHHDGGDGTRHNWDRREPIGGMRLADWGRKRPTDWGWGLGFRWCFCSRDERARSMRGLLEKSDGREALISVRPPLGGIIYTPG
jgi:hypothetical protein